MAYIPGPPLDPDKNGAHVLNLYLEDGIWRDWQDNASEVVKVVDIYAEGEDGSVYIGSVDPAVIVEMYGISRDELSGGVEVESDEDPHDPNWMYPHLFHNELASRTWERAEGVGHGVGADWSLVPTVENRKRTRKTNGGKKNWSYVKPVNKQSWSWRFVPDMISAIFDTVHQAAEDNEWLPEGAVGNVQKTYDVIMKFRDPKDKGREPSLIVQDFVQEAGAAKFIRAAIGEHLFLDEIEVWAHFKEGRYDPESAFVVIAHINLSQPSWSLTVDYDVGG